MSHELSASEQVANDLLTKYIVNGDTESAGEIIKKVESDTEVLQLITLEHVRLSIKHYRYEILDLLLKHHTFSDQDIFPYLYNAARAHYNDINVFAIIANEYPTLLDQTMSGQSNTAIRLFIDNVQINALRKIERKTTVLAVTGILLVTTLLGCAIGISIVFGPIYLIPIFAGYIATMAPLAMYSDNINLKKTLIEDLKPEFLDSISQEYEFNETLTTALQEQAKKNKSYRPKKDSQPAFSEDDDDLDYYSDTELLEQSQDRKKRSTQSSQGIRNTKSLKKSAYKLSQGLHSALTDLTGEASLGQLSPIIGRDREIHELVKCFMRPSGSKASAMLLGEAGTGKTAIVEKLAQLIAFNPELLPVKLRNYRILKLDVRQLDAGDGRAGTRAAKFQEVLKEMRKLNTIVFIDEFHSFIGTGTHAHKKTDFMEDLKPYLARGEVKCIGATTHDEYREHVRQNAALARRFTDIKISEPSNDEVIEILLYLKSKWEEEYHVIISDELCKKVVELTSRILPSRRMPDKAIDVLSDAALESYIAQDISTLNGNAVTLLLDDLLKIIEKKKKSEFLHEALTDLTEEARSGQLSSVIGRDREVHRLLRCFMRPTGSKASAMLLGEAGTGKTAIVEKLAQLIAFNPDLLPEPMRDYRILKLDVRQLDAGDGRAGTRAAKFQEVLKEITRPNTIVFIDEFHSFIGTGTHAHSATGFLEDLKPYLARGEVKCIGATTFNEYEQYVKGDTALIRRFTNIEISEPSNDEVIEILQHLKYKWEKEYNILISDELCKKVVELTSRILPSRRMPDKAIDVLSDAALEFFMQQVSPNFTNPPVSLSIDFIIQEVRKRQILSSSDIILVNDRVNGPDSPATTERDELTSDLVDKISRTAGTHIMLVGNKAVGKTAVINGLASYYQRQGNATQIYSINLIEWFAVKPVEQIRKDLLKFQQLGSAENTIIVIEGLDALNKTGNLRANYPQIYNMLKTIFMRPEIQLITTISQGWL